MKTSIRLMVLSLLGGVALYSLPAAAQQDVNARMNRLENEIQTLSRAVFRNEMPPPGEMQSMGAASGSDPASQASLEVRLSQLEGEVSNLTGKLEEQNFTIRQMQEKIDALADIDRRMKASPSAASGDPGMTGGNPPQPASGSTATSAPLLTSPQPAAPGGANQNLGSLTQAPGGEFVAGSGTPADEYEHAYTLLRDKNYDAAEKAFTDFLARNPQSDLAPNAKYWLGETYYVRGNFERAARVFAEAYQLYPKSPKGPDNLLKLALSLNGMGKKDDACLALAQLKTEYPAGATPVLARAERERENIGCK